VQPLKQTHDPADYDFYEVEEVLALVRAAAEPATDDPPTAEQTAAAAQDAALFLTAAFTGLRLGELLALRIRDVDFDGEAIRVMGSVDTVEGVGTPNSGKGRSVPMVPQVATALARLLLRDRFVGPDDHVFAGAAGRYLDGSALRRRYKAAQTTAKLRPLLLP
jgi:integrase